MKKVISILLLVLLAYNMAGYYVVFILRQIELKQNITQTLEQGKVTEEEMFIVKVPIPLYHQTDRKNFEILQGEFEYKGNFYEMVKQKVENDTLFVYCFDNKHKTTLFADLSRHTQTHIIDFSGNQPQPTEKLVKSFIKEYLSLPEIDFNFSPFSVKQVISFFFSAKPFTFFAEIPSPPPKQV